jgi:hypothetical protein
MMKSKFLALLVLSLLALVSPARAENPNSPAAPSAQVTTSTEAGATLPRGTALGSRSEAHRYAAREAASPEAKQYRGGDVIVISATAVAIILLVIVIIILL